MATQELNDLLTRTDSGTPCGELMRRYWQPAALSEELPPGGAPLPVRLLGEDLVLFRDDAGQPGLLGLHCAHRGADLSYGRIEDGGLRCIYHGWLYDRTGQCLEQPGEPAGSTFYQRIKQPAYPCVEAGGLILAYMGPGEPPRVPALEFLSAPGPYRFVTKIFHACNYLQASEGNFDPQHTSYLHRIPWRNHESMTYIANDGAPLLDCEETDFGLRIYSVRRVSEERNYVRATYFILPNISAFGGQCEGYQVNWHVPIDDTHHWKYEVVFNRSTPISPQMLGAQQHAMDDGFMSSRNAANRYLQDRESMHDGLYAGLGRDFYDHDLWATETQGQIMDRTLEHLGYTDRAVVASRNVLLRAINDVREGREPLFVQRDASIARPVEVLTRAEVLPSDVQWRTAWAQQTVLDEERSWSMAEASSLR